MKEIILTRGFVAQVSDEDYAMLSRLKWQYGSGGYACHNTHVGGKSVTLLMHRFILCAKKGEIVDHLDLNKLNNQRENIRIVTSSQNNQNRKGAPLPKFRGVFLGQGNNYYAQISSGENKIFLGSFSNPLEAALAYDKAAREIYGENAMTNERMFREEKG